VGPALTSGAQAAGQTAQKGARTYFRWLVRFWTAIFRMVAEVFSFLWVVVSFVPRKIIGLLKRKK
jgi:hypothetical protein